MSRHWTDLLDRIDHEAGTLPAADISEIGENAIDLGLARPSRRQDLLRGLAERIVAMLPIRSTPAEQLMSDIRTLNRMTLAAGEPAIALWIRNADELVGLLHRAGRRPGPADHHRSFAAAPHTTRRR